MLSLIGIALSQSTEPLFESAQANGTAEAGLCEVRMKERKRLMMKGKSERGW